jgi:hypothetical protein
MSLHEGDIRLRHMFAALTSNTGGSDNTATGINALTTNTSGQYNTATGEAALSTNTTGYNNTANGVSDLYENTSGYANTGNGLQALYNDITEYHNEAFGNRALFSEVSGNNNIAPRECRPATEIELKRTDVCRQFEVVHTRERPQRSGELSGIPFQIVSPPLFLVDL